MNRRPGARWVWCVAGFAFVSLVWIVLAFSYPGSYAHVEVVGGVLAAGFALAGFTFAAQGFRRALAAKSSRTLAFSIAGLGLTSVLIAYLVMGLPAIFANQGTHPSTLAETPTEFQRPSINAPTAVWIDTDPACGVGDTDDVDDCWALVAALNSPELRICGISTVAGNLQDSAGGHVLDRLLRILRPQGNTPPVFLGAAGPDSGPTPASMALRDALSHEKLLLIAQGPLTNLAEVLKSEPALAANIDRIVMVAGKRPGELLHPGKQWWFHFRDFNVCKDTSAVRSILYSGIPITLVPFDLAVQVTIDQSDMERLGASSPAGEWLRRESSSWFSFWTDFLGQKGFNPFDALAVGYVLRPDLYNCEVLPARIGFNFFLEPFDMGRDLEVSADIKGPPVTYCRSVRPEIKSVILDRLTAAPDAASAPQ